MKSVIIYTTKYGTVEKAAEMLKSKMNGEVTLINIAKEKAPKLDEYDNVIIGGSIYIGKIQNKLKEYTSRNIQLLIKKKVGLFICAAQSEPTASQELQRSFPPELYKHASVKDILGHEFDFEKLNFLDRLITRKVTGIKESQFNLSEEKIENFAKSFS